MSKVNRFYFFEGVVLDVLLSEPDKVHLLIVGHNHAENIASLLTSLSSWKMVQQKSLLEHISATQAIFYTNKTFEGDFRSAIREALKPLVRIACAQCQQQEELRMCSRCRQVYYCSQACQQKAWKVHKKVCTPLKVKI